MEKAAGLKLFLISGAVLLGVGGTILAIGAIEAASNGPRDSKTVSVESYDGASDFKLTSKMTVHIDYDNYEGQAYFSLLDDTTFNDYIANLQEQGYNLTKPADDFFVVQYRHDGFDYCFFVSGPFSSPAANYSLQNVPFQCPILLVKEYQNMLEDLDLVYQEPFSKTCRYTTDHDYADFKAYFSKINFSDIAYHDEENTNVYDDTYRFLIDSGEVLVSPT